MDQEFQRALLITGLAGALIATIGTAVLIVVFRRFGEAKAGGRAHITLIVSLVAFLFLVCALLFALSYSRW